LPLCARHRQGVEHEIGQFQSRQMVLEAQWAFAKNEALGGNTTGFGFRAANWRLRKDVPPRAKAQLPSTVERMLIQVPNVSA